MDIGGHRFFSKSDVVMDWWTNILKLQGAPSRTTSPSAADCRPTQAVPIRKTA